MSIRGRVSIAICSVVALAVACRSVTRLVLFPVAEIPEAAGLPAFVEQRLLASDGVPVRALELRGPEGSPVVVHFHNNREVAEQSEVLGQELAARGVGVLLVEYRGYGASHAGTPSEEGFYADAEAALALLASRGIPPSQIVLWGTSLGTGVAAEMARRGRGGRLVLVTPYTSIPGLVTDLLPLVPAGILIADHFDTLSKAPGIAIPTTVVHGDADEIVPFRMGEHLAKTIPGARLLKIAGGRHGDLLQRARPAIIDTLVGVPGR